MTFATRVRTIQSRDRSRDAIWLIWASVISSAGVGAATGLALHWEPVFTVCAASAFAVSTYLARSIARALMCFVAALGLVAGAMTILLAVGPDVPAAVGIRWSWLAYAIWLVMLGCAWGFRHAQLERRFGIAELVGAWIAIATALRMLKRIDYHGDLLRYLVHVEDNQAWVGLTTQVSAHDSLGNGFGYLGPVIPTLIGLLHTFQQSDIAMYNATFSAYALAVILVPIIAAGLVGVLPFRGTIATATFAVLMMLWVYQVPYLLFGSYGHLSAMWAFLLLLLVGSLLAIDDLTPRLLPVALGLVMAGGAMWFPLTALGCAVVVVVTVRVFRGARPRHKAVTLVASLVALWCLYKQLKDVVGSGASEGVSHLQSALTPLYAAKGGTAAIDGPLFLAILLILLGLGVLASRLDYVSVRWWRWSLGLVAYIAVIYAGSYYLKVDIGYGPTKVAFICGMASLIGVLVIAVRQPLPQRAVYALMIVLFMASFVYGGGGAVLARSWPGGGVDPIWLKPIETVSAEQSPDDPRPIGCFSNQVYDSYACTRWASGMTLSGDGPFLDYRLSVINQGDSAGAVKAIVDGGALADSDLIVLELPSEANAWGWDLIAHADRVYGVDGKLIEPRPTPPA
jgi:hypothetical protein